MSQTVIVGVSLNRLGFDKGRAKERRVINVVTKPRHRDLPDGKAITEWLSAAGQLHRDPRDGPALVIFYPDGEVMEENYCFHDRCHRDDGPAVIEYDGYGRILAEERWLNGIEVERRQYS